MHYLLVNISKQMSLNKIISFLLLFCLRAKSGEQNTSSTTCSRLNYDIGITELLSELDPRTLKTSQQHVSITSQCQYFLVQECLTSLAFNQPFQPRTPTDFKDYVFLAELCGRKSLYQGMVWLGQKKNPWKQASAHQNRHNCN